MNAPAANALGVAPWRTPLELTMLGAIWGGSFLFMRVAAADFGPLPLVEARLALGALTLLPLLWAARAQFSGALWLRIAGIAAINSVIPFALFAWGAERAPAGIGAISNAMTVIFTALIAFHREHGQSATVTAVQPPGRFGAMEVEGERVREFEEKPRGDGAWMNGGFFVLSPSVDRYLEGDKTVWEQEPMRALASEGQLVAYRHQGFWQAMDTLRDRNQLDQLWSSGQAPWRTWS